MTVNDTTNSLTTRIIFGNNRKPQDQFNYRDMGDESDNVAKHGDPWALFDSKNRPIFPGYKFVYDKEESKYGVHTYNFISDECNEVINVVTTKLPENGLVKRISRHEAIRVTQLLLMRFEVGYSSAIAVVLFAIMIGANMLVKNVLSKVGQ